MTNIINVVFITDKNYFDPMLVTINSMLKNSLRQFKLTIFLTYSPQEYENSQIEKFLKLKNVIDIEMKTVNSIELTDLRAKNHVSSAAFIKVMLPELLTNIERILYLDSDLLIRDDVGLLLDCFGENKEIAAVRSADYFVDNPHLGLKKHDETFNSGVMVMNLELMRINKRKNQLLEFLKKKNEDTFLNDQAAFNSVFKYNWQILDISWNVYIQNFLYGKKYLRYSEKEIKLSRKNPKIIHFNGSIKPWNTKSAHPYAKEYHMYAKNLINLDNLYNKRHFIFDTTFYMEKLIYFRGKLVLKLPFLDRKVF